MLGQMGWYNNPSEALRCKSTLQGKDLVTATAPPTNETVILTDFAKKLGVVLPKGPQKIGDCVSWGSGNFLNLVQVMQILGLVQQNDQSAFEKLMMGEPTDILKQMNLQWKEVATESIYGFSRCEVGQQWNSQDDGSVGAWAAKALEQFGVLTRDLTGPYDPAKAKLWGAKGVPDQFEPEAKLHLIKNTTPVSNFNDAAALIQAKRPVFVCSNRGFELIRDSQGFCRQTGVWQHCMLFMGVRMDRQGLLCMQSWGSNMPSGPQVLNQPDNTFFVDARVADDMLSQGDSYTGTGFKGYEDAFDWSF